MKLNAIICNKCGDTIYSRCRYDFHWCTCKSIAIDGGLHYTKVSFTDELPMMVTIEVNANEKELYNDWNTEKNKFGIIRRIKI